MVPGSIPIMTVDETKGYSNKMNSIQSNILPKGNSRSGMLRLLFARKALSRTEIAASLNISTAAVTNSSRELLDLGILIPCDSSEKVKNSHQVGRRQSLLSINPEWKYILAIEIYTGHFSLAVTDLLGETIAKRYYPRTEKENTSSPEDFFSDLADKCQELLSAEEISSSRLLGAGVSIQGTVDHIDGIAINPYFRQGPIPVGEYLEPRLHIPVTVENNICSVLQSELTFRNHVKDQDNILMLRWGPGVGTAMAIGGSIYKGHQFQSPEVGHNSFSSGRGLPCRCGRQGCLETVISSQAISSDIRHLLETGKDDELEKFAGQHGAPSPDNILAYLNFEDPTLKKLILRHIKRIVNAVNNAVIVLAPDILVLYGDFFKSDLIFDSFSQLLMKRNPILPPDFCVRYTSLSEKPFIGCTSIAIEQILFKEDFLL